MKKRYIICLYLVCFIGGVLTATGVYLAHKEYQEYRKKVQMRTEHENALKSLPLFSKIRFISSSKEVEEFVDVKQPDFALVISIEAYKANPEKVHEIVRRLRRMQYVPIGLYGQPFDYDVASELFGERMACRNCGPDLIAIGMLSLWSTSRHVPSKGSFATEEELKRQAVEAIKFLEESVKESIRRYRGENQIK